MRWDSVWCGTMASPTANLTDQAVFLTRAARHGNAPVSTQGLFLVQCKEREMRWDSVWCGTMASPTANLTDQSVVRVTRCSPWKRPCFNPVTLSTQGLCLVLWNLNFFSMRSKVHPHPLHRWGIFRWRLPCCCFTGRQKRRKTRPLPCRLPRIGRKLAAIAEGCRRMDRRSASPQRTCLETREKNRIFVAFVALYFEVYSFLIHLKNQKDQIWSFLSCSNFARGIHFFFILKNPS